MNQTKKKKIYIVITQTGTLLSRVIGLVSGAEYNHASISLAAFGICYSKADCFYCSEFVREMLEEGRVSGCEQLDSIVHPIHFLELPDAHLIYRGRLREYSQSEE